MNSRQYLDDKGRLIFVARGLGSEFGTFYRTPSGGLRRVKSPAMEMTPSESLAQKNLDKYAAKHKLTEFVQRP